MCNVGIWEALLLYMKSPKLFIYPILGDNESKKKAVKLYGMGVNVLNKGIEIELNGEG